MLSKFLASKGVTLVLIAVVSLGAAGFLWYYTSQAEERGRLEEAVSDARADNEAWRARFDRLQRDRELYAEMDRELERARRERRDARENVTRRIEELRREIPSVDDYLSATAPDPYARILCDDGIIDPAACESGSGAVSDAVREGDSERGDDG